MGTFKVQLWIEKDGGSEDDLVVERTVTAGDQDEAKAKARELVRRENPEINIAKNWFWAVEEMAG